MKIQSRDLDHLVYCVMDLEDAILEIFKKTGIRAAEGGRHLNQGTKNALIKLGEQSYLELLAIDSENKNITRSRWMGIDLIRAPKITRWAIHSQNLEEDSAVLKRCDDRMGEIIIGAREKESGSSLRWKMTKPLSTPEVELIPFMIDWSLSESHPSNDLQQQCRLVSLSFHDNLDIRKVDALHFLFGDFQIEEASEASIRATIEGPSGSMIL